MRRLLSAVDQPNLEALTMAYDEKLADRIRRTLGPEDDIEERKMFGGLAFLRGGRMFVGITGEDLMVRVGPERYEESLGKPHVRPMDFTGRPLKGYVYVAPAGRRTDASLRAWVMLGARFVATMPAQKPRRRRAPGPKRRR
jgi:TfoX/Sxy family transcriptional regulator of competence genes